MATFRITKLIFLKLANSDFGTMATQGIKLLSENWLARIRRFYLFCAMHLAKILKNETAAFPSIKNLVLIRVQDRCVAAFRNLRARRDLDTSRMIANTQCTQRQKFGAGAVGCKVVKA